MKTIIATLLVAIAAITGAASASATTSGATGVAQRVPRDPAWTSLRPGQSKDHVQAVLGSTGWRVSLSGDWLVKGYDVQGSVVTVTYYDEALVSYAVDRP